MYLESTETDFSTLYQGDIIKDFPFFVINESLKVVKSIDEKTFEVQSDKLVKEKHLVLIESRPNLVMVLSQTCDVQNRQNVLICPVYSLQSLKDLGALSTSNEGLLKKRRMNYWFYLPGKTPLEESLADFQTIHYIPKAVIDQYKSDKMLSLSDWGRHHLSWVLANYFGRPIENK